MQISSQPALLSILWGANAGGSYIRAVPGPSQIGINNGFASFTDGFPPLTFVPVASGGVPPFGADMNGILNQITQTLQWNQVGAPYVWNGAFSTAIGGYPKGARLLSADGTHFWTSAVDNNTSNPETGGANWYYSGGTPFTNNTVSTTGATYTTHNFDPAKIRVYLDGALQNGLASAAFTYTNDSPTGSGNLVLNVDYTLYTNLLVEG